MSLRSTVLKYALLPLLAAALAGFSVPSFAYDWQKVAPKNGGFSVDFPGTPKLSSHVGQDERDNYWMYGDKRRQLLVLASTGDFYNTHVGEVRHEAEVRFLKDINGTSTSSKQGWTRGANGKKLPSSVFTFVMGNGWKGVSKVIEDGDTIYMTVVMWGKGAHAAAVRKRFMGSYKLVPRTRPSKPDGAK